MPSPPKPKLFSPIKVGNVQLQHRIVLAPLTRCKATRGGHVPVTSLMQEYYSQRSSVPGTLLLTDATFIALEAGGMHHIPGIWSPEQVREWKKIVEAVHANGSYIFLQLWALGRAAHPKTLEEEGGNLPYISSSATPLSHRPATDPLPRELTTEEIDHYVDLYVAAAKNAIEAGFDGVEVHGANGYLIDQFLQDVCNKRTDEYGGSVANRSRFGLRVVAAVAKAVGEKNTGVRLSPWGRFQGMKMEDPVPQFSHFVSALANAHPNLAYLHLVEPLVEYSVEGEPESNDFLREIWAPRPLISCGDHTRERALQLAEDKGDLTAFGRLFISNPDLPFRLQHDVPLAKPDQSTFYTTYETPGVEKGYIDYPFSEEFLEAKRSLIASREKRQRIIKLAYFGIASIVGLQILSSSWK